MRLHLPSSDYYWIYGVVQTWQSYGKPNSVYVHVYISCLLSRLDRQLAATNAIRHCGLENVQVVNKSTKPLIHRNTIDKASCIYRRQSTLSYKCFMHKSTKTRPTVALHLLSCLLFYYNSYKTLFSYLPADQLNLDDLRWPVANRQSFLVKDTLREFPLVDSFSNFSFKVCFHYPSSRPVNSARELG